MIHAPTFVASAAPLLPTVSGWPGYSLSYQLESAAISGPAIPTSQTQKRGGAVQTLVQREILAGQAKKARNMRRSKEASLIEAALMALNHSILGAGRG